MLIFPVIPTVLTRVSSTTFIFPLLFSKDARVRLEKNDEKKKRKKKERGGPRNEA